jgi:hypothetical protein
MLVNSHPEADEWTILFVNEEFLRITGASWRPLACFCRMRIACGLGLRAALMVRAVCREDTRRGCGR